MKYDTRYRFFHVELLSYLNGVSSAYGACFPRDERFNYRGGTNPHECLCRKGTPLTPMVETLAVIDIRTFSLILTLRRTLSCKHEHCPLLMMTFHLCFGPGIVLWAFEGGRLGGYCYSL